MENASKALTMAGGLLIAMLLVAFMVFMLRKAGMMSAEFDSQMSNNELEKFNSQFEYYNRKDNNFLDIITVCNLAYDVNKKNGFDSSNAVVIEIGNHVGNTMYSILPDSSLEKNYFLDTSGNPVYMYEKMTEGEYGAMDTNTGKYTTLFECTETSYNDKTGKIKNMKFQIQ